MISGKKITEPVLYLILIIALLAPRLPALDSFVTLDEPYWLSMGANFYYALGQREFENTVYEYQPAVTTMWIVTAAMMIYFPEYRGLGQGYLEFEKGALDPFLIAHGKDPLVLLQISRVLQVIWIAFLFLILYYLLKKIISAPAAFFAIAFASLDPFFLSQSRILDHEAMLSLFVIISILALMVYQQSQNIVFLILSGTSAGLAQLTKSSAIAILAPAGILFLWSISKEQKSRWLPSLIKHSKTFLLWFSILAFTYFIFWPGMWVAPKKMLYEVYGNAFSYAFQGARLKVTGEIESSQISLETNKSGILSLAQTILRRTTPLTWLGLLISAALSTSREEKQKRNFLLPLLWATATAFVLMFGIAQGRNSPHYVLCAYLALNLISGIGFFYLAQKITRRNFSSAVMSFIVILQAASALSTYPYYFTYQNPLTKSAAPLFPYGEGLERAAQYLSTQPNAEQSTALVYYARGCFSYFYSGNTARFKPYYAESGYASELSEALGSSDYLVIYYAVQGKMDKYSNLLSALEKVKPIHEVWLNGYKYVVIYRVSDISQAALNSLSHAQPAEQP